MPSFNVRGQPLFPAVVLLIALGPTLCASGADRIELRNLKTITERTVASFDLDGVKLDDGTVLAWDEIERASIQADRQSAFDALLKELGGPLYRIRQRLTTGDYEGLLPHAEATYGRYAARDSETAYMVKQALMWGRLAVGQREGALEPYLRCLMYHLAHRGQVRLPGHRRLRIDAQTGLTPELVPVWFDARSARESLPEVFRRIGELPRPRPAGVYVYYVSLALAAGEKEAAARVLHTIPTDVPVIGELRLILAAQQEIVQGQPGEAVATLSDASGSLSSGNRALARYWLGLSQLAGPDDAARRRGMLELLWIPAVRGRESPELAAAALFHVMNELARGGDARGSVAVRNELLERYGQTWFAAQARAAPADTSATKETP